MRAIEAGAVRAAREAKDQKIIHAFGITGHSHRGTLIECMKRFDPDTVLTTFLATEGGRVLMTSCWRWHGPDKWA